MPGQTQIIVLVVVVMAAMGAYAYIQSLKADLAVSESNNQTLTTAVDQQRQAIQQMQDDVKTSQRLNQQLNTAIQLQNKDLQTLREKLNRVDANGNTISIGNLAVKKTGVMEKKVNQGTNNAYRCMEIASGSPLTEQEKNASKKSEINPECPSLANPGYQP